MWSGTVIHKNDVCFNCTSEQIHMENYHLLTIAISRYRTKQNEYRKHGSPSARSVLCLPRRELEDQRPEPHPELSQTQLTFRNTFGTETILIFKKNMTPLMRCQVFVLFAPLKTVPPMANFQVTQHLGRRANRPPF